MTMTRLNLLRRQDGGKGNGDPSMEIRRLAREMRGGLYLLENCARHSEDATLRRQAFNTIAAKAKELRAALIAKNSEIRLKKSRGVSFGDAPVLIEELQRNYESCHYSLERLTWADDREIRMRAFELVKGNIGALRVSCAISPHADIRIKAGEMLRKGKRRKRQEPKEPKNGEEKAEKEGTRQTGTGPLENAAASP